MVCFDKKFLAVKRISINYEIIVHFFVKLRLELVSHSIFSISLID